VFLKKKVKLGVFLPPPPSHRLSSSFWGDQGKPGLGLITRENLGWLHGAYTAKAEY